MEKTSGTFWINVFRDKNDGFVWLSGHRMARIDADKSAETIESDGEDERIACIKSEWIEGQGLEMPS